MDPGISLLDEEQIDILLSLILLTSIQVLLFMEALIYSVRPELVEGKNYNTMISQWLPFMVRQGSPERSRRAHYERWN